MTPKVWIALAIITVLVVFAMWFSGWFAQFRMLRKDEIPEGWRIRLGAQLACFSYMQGIGHRLIASGIRQQTPDLSDMQRAVLLRQAKEEEFAEMTKPTSGESHGG